MPEYDSVSEDVSIAIRDRYLGPSLYSPIAEDLARRLARVGGGPILEILADFGMLTQATAVTVSVDVAVIATDPSMSAVNRASAKPGMSRVTWQRADPAALNFSNHMFGTVTSMLGIATAAQRGQIFKEVRRVLRPEGRFLFAVPAHIRHSPVAACIQEALSERFATRPPGFLSERLYGYTDSETIDDELTQAGFTDAVYTAVDLPFTASSAREIAIGFCLGTDLRTEIEALANGDASHATEMICNTLRRKFGDGEVSSTMRLNVVSAAG